MNKKQILNLFVLFAGLSASCIYAQPTPSSPNQAIPLPEALKDIPASTGMCRKEDFVSAPSDAKRSARKADPSCAINIDQLSNFLGKPNAVLIDVRPKTAFENSHIDGAINFTASEVRTKHYLADKMVVLVGDGKADHELYELCSELKSHGFKSTKVLVGGMLSWALESKPVVGVAPDFSQLLTLSNVELFQEVNAPNNVLVGLSGGSKLSDVIRMEAKLGGSDLKSVAEFIKKRKKPAAPYNVVVVADDRFKADQFVELARLVKPAPLLVYRDSEASYRQFLKVQNAMWVKQEKGPTKPRCGV